MQEIQLAREKHTIEGANGRNVHLRQFTGFPRLFMYEQQKGVNPHKQFGFLSSSSLCVVSGFAASGFVVPGIVGAGHALVFDLFLIASSHDGAGSGVSSAITSTGRRTSGSFLTVGVSHERSVMVEP